MAPSPKKSPAKAASARSPAENAAKKHDIQSLLSNESEKESLLSTPGRMRMFFAVLALAILLYWLPSEQFQEAITITKRGFRGGRFGLSKCEKYAIMIDAGSAGSRLHVYRFHQCQPENPIKLMKEELFVQTIPGLSAYGDEPARGAASLKPLLQQAVDIIPRHLHKTSPIAVKATAGLRLLDGEKGEVILDAVYDMLQSYPFPLPGGRSAVSIMDGRDEGVYAWITVNFLLGNLAVANDTERPPTAAVFDLGGGSTQIVFEPKWDDANQTVMEGDHKYTLKYDQNTYILYQHSYLGYGLMEARKRMHHRIVEMASGSHEGEELDHPCLPRDLQWSYPKHQASPKAVFRGGGTHKVCNDMVLEMLNKNAVCMAPPCSFDGIHQPPIAEAFKHGPIYVFSYFYDRTQPLGLPDRFKLPQLAQLTERVCSGEYLAGVVDPALRAEMLDRPEWCLDLTFIHGLLAHGYEIPDDREIRVAKKIDGVETGWCLGAAIALLDANTLS